MISNFNGEDPYRTTSDPDLEAIAAPSEQSRCNEPPETLPPASPNTAHGSATPGTESFDKAPCMPRVPGYHILDVLGQGGMGIVYHASQLSLKRDVVLKTLLAGRHGRSGDLSRFRTEAEAAATLTHPNIVQVHEVIECDGQPFLVMEFVSGSSLDKKLAGLPQPARWAAEMVEKLAIAMDYAHERGIVHRDLKPANVLLTSEDVPKITDFGLAKQLDDDMGQTSTGAIIGTPSYMPPEQASGKGKDARPAMDIYGLGAILYEMLTGRPPFKASTVLDTLQQVRTEEPLPPHAIMPGIPRDVETICLKCLEKNPIRRYASAKDLADDLRKFLNNERIKASQRGLWTRTCNWFKRRSRLVAAATAVAVFGVSLSIGIYGWRTGHGQPTSAATTSPENDSLVQSRIQEVHREVADLLRSPPTAPDDPVFPHQEFVERLPAVDHSAFYFYEDQRIWDFRLYRPVSRHEGEPPNGVFVCSTRLRLKKIKPTDAFRYTARTAGEGVALRCLNEKNFHVLAQKRRELVGGHPMVARQIVIDVSHIPIGEEFNLQLKTTYRSSLERDEHRWVGTVGYTGSFKPSILLLFPPDRPFGAHELLVAPIGEEKQMPFEGPKIEIAGAEHEFLYWEVLEPRPNHVYQVRWRW